jgi:hypothetical protein
MYVNQPTASTAPAARGPSPRRRPLAREFCENGAKAVAEEATTRASTPSSSRAHVASCSQSDYWLGSRAASPTPCVLRAGATTLRADRLGRGLRALVADELNALASPDEAAFYTSGRTSNEAAFLYQLFVRQFGTNNLPDCSNMCHESSGVALGETIGVGKGTVTLDDFDLADADLRHRPEPRHEPPAHALDAAARRSGAAPRSSTSTRCPRRADALQAPAGPGDAARRRHASSPTSSCRSRQRRRGAAQGLDEGGAGGEKRAPGRSARPRLHRRAHHRLREFARDAARSGELGERSSRAASRASRSREAATSTSTRARHRLLGDGAHAAQERGRDIRRSSTSAAARQRRPPRRGRVPGARPQQRAGRPHDGHLGAPGRRLPRRARARVRLRAAARATASTPSRRSRRCTRGASASSSRWAATSSPPRPTRRDTAGRCAAAGSPCTCSTKLNRAHLVTGARR